MMNRLNNQQTGRQALMMAAVGPSTSYCITAKDQGKGLPHDHCSENGIQYMSHTMKPYVRPSHRRGTLFSTYTPPLHV